MFINAAGPYAKQINSLVFKNNEKTILPLVNEIHGKVIFRDNQNIIPPNSPMMICADSTKMFWSTEELEYFNSSDESVPKSWFENLPSGLHFRPYANSALLMLWEFVHLDTRVEEPPPEEIKFSPDYTEMIIRGTTTIVPQFQEYIGKRGQVDGGYYCKTKNNIPIIDQIDLSISDFKLLQNQTDNQKANKKGNYFVIGGLSGFGMMASCAAGELISKKIHKEPLPNYSKIFELGTILEDISSAEYVPNKEVQL